MKRHAKSYCRENTIKLLYSYSIEKRINDDTMTNITDPLAEKWTQYIIANESEFNNLIEKYLNKWKLSELNPIVLAIFQVAIYEMKYDDTPTPIIINEAIDFTKVYCDDNARGFVTYVLKEINKELNG